ncbi:MAG: metallophosphoesterase family protein [bacterium]
MKSSALKIHRNAVLTVILIIIQTNYIFGLAVVHGPRINAVFEDSAFITVETDLSSQLIIRWGLSGYPYSDSLFTADSDSFHNIVLSGLSGYRHYHYSATVFNFNDTVEIPDRDFNAPALPGQQFSFVIIGDSQNWGQSAPTPEIFKKLVLLIVQDDPDFVLLLGDAVYGSDDSVQLLWQWDNWKQATDTLAYSTPIYMVIGNHDALTYYHLLPFGEKIFKNEFMMPQNGPSPYYQELVYCFNWGDACFFILDSDLYYNPSVIDQVQRAWLFDQLNQCTSPLRFAAQHEYAWGPYGGSGHYLGDYPDQRDAYWKVLRDGNVIMDFCGHLHLYNSDFFGINYPDTISCIKQLVSGGGGGPLVSGFGGDFYHYCRIQVNSTQIVVEVIDTLGTVVDYFTLVGIEELATPSREESCWDWLMENISGFSGLSPLNQRLIISDLSGRIIDNQYVSQGQLYNFNPAHSGIYFLMSIDERGMNTKKFCILR